jgi:transketolase
MNMRGQLVATVEALMQEDQRLVTLLGDIGVFGFRKAFEQFPQRIYNIGILEQATISLAAGLASTGLIPVVHTIAPFLVERALEQLKIDFCYQRLGGNFVSVGGSYDYAALGCTHHCPGDIALLRSLPGMQIIVPGTAAEFDTLFRQSWANGSPTYFRLSESQNPVSFEQHFGKAMVVKTGSKATAVVVGPLLGTVMEAADGLDITILYYTCLAPFDGETLSQHCHSNRILLCEPYYSGTLLRELHAALPAHPLTVDTVGMPLEFLEQYGHKQQHDQSLDFTADAIRRKLERLCQ